MFASPKFNSFNIFNQYLVSFASLNAIRVFWVNSLGLEDYSSS